MKKIIEFIFSPRTTVLLLLILAVAMGSATIVEEKYDTETAKTLVYNAKWFEAVMLLLVLNFLGSIKRHHLLSAKKISGFIFHFAFIIIIIGAAVTRYTGFTGTMHIRNGELSNTMFTADPYLRISVKDGENTISGDLPVHISQIGSNHMEQDMVLHDKRVIHVAYKSMIKNAVDSVIENVADGKDMIGLVVPGDNGRESVFINKGESKDAGRISISYNNNDATDVNIIEKDGVFYIKSAFTIARTAMPAMTKDTLRQDSVYEFKQRCLYESKLGVFVFKQFYKNAKKVLVEGKGEGSGVDALNLEVSINDKQQMVQVMGGANYVANYQDVSVGNIPMKIGFGVKELTLPFSLYLNKFILERYAGSMSPSSFTSDVTLVDKRNGLKTDKKIFMNNVLDYDGYRFFQSSYDPDEKGTILSVNHDFWGTWISYAGYFLLALGFLLTLLNKNSRFYALNKAINNIRAVRKSMLLLFLFSSIGIPATMAQTADHVSADHAEKFGHLIVQTFDGRFEPVNSLAFDVLHKIGRKDVFEIEGVGKMDAMQVFEDMMLHAEFWKVQKIIYIKENSVKELLGVEGKYACFNDFFDEKGNYKLKEQAEKSFRKKQADQNAFDKEIIKTDERANVFMMVLNGSMLKLFPSAHTMNNAWISWDDSLAYLPITGSLQILNDELQLRTFTFNSIMGLYLQEVFNASKSGDYIRAEKVMNYIRKIQHTGATADYLPSDTKLNFETQYNKANIFIKLRNLYGMLSMVLLVLSFIDVLSVRRKKVVSWLLTASIIILGFAFIYHTYGMILRWYLTGHAPWSTGYEALLLIGWGALLAGFSFMKGSKVTLAATTLLAFFVLMTASHSSYDPQLTNLQPVLKSYWLIIHVATLTISYGFLGLGFFLGLFSMVLYLFKNETNRERLDSITFELTSINEMNLSIGLFLATVGTFLGGIWANESWGKYWGWDAKETWALVIVITYSIVLHLRLASKLKGEYFFNIGAILGFGSVLMTFIGVNYYLSKGLHSYAAGDTPIFPIWAWLTIIAIIVLIVLAGFKQKSLKRDS